MELLIITLVGLVVLLTGAVIVLAWRLSIQSRTAALSLIAEATRREQPVEATQIEKLLERRPARVGKWFAIICLMLGVPGLGIGVALALSGSMLVQGATGAGMMVGAMVNLSNGVGLTTLGLISLRQFGGGDARAEPHWDFAGVLSLVCLFFGVAGMSVGTGLALGSQFYGPIGAAGAVRMGLLTGALVNALSGLGLTALGVFLRRAFSEPREIEDN